MDGLMLKYFVLKPKGKDIYAKASRTAMRAYARVIRNDNLEFAEQLSHWASDEGAEAEFGKQDQSAE